MSFFEKFLGQGEGKRRKRRERPGRRDERSLEGGREGRKGKARRSFPERIGASASRVASAQALQGPGGRSARPKGERKRGERKERRKEREERRRREGRKGKVRRVFPERIGASASRVARRGRILVYLPCLIKTNISLIHSSNHYFDHLIILDLDVALDL